MSQNLTCWCFHAVDSWFFRESRAHDAVGVSELSSVFPPPSRTLMGALRTFIGDQLGVDWKAFGRGAADPTHQALLGDADDLGELTLAGVVIRHRGETLWPWPADLMLGEQQGKPALSRLMPGAAVHCDLGRVALPEAAQDIPPGSKVPENAWLTEAGARAWLQGKLPEPQHIVTMGDLVEQEPRLGIARNVAKGTVIEGQLYQTRHLRFRDPSTCIEVYVGGVPQAIVNDCRASQTLRLGGEGRAATVEVAPVSDLPLPTLHKASGKQLVLWLVTPGDVPDADSDSGLPGFQRCTTAEGQDVWEGELAGVSLRLVAACRGRALREGGWDQRRHQPKPIRSYLSLGSVFFCTLLDDLPLQEAQARLHGTQLGNATQWGLGRLLVTGGSW